MAAKKDTRSKRTTRGKKAEGSVRDLVMDAALSIAAEDGWSAVSPKRIAQKSGVSLGQVIAVSPTRSRTAALLFQRVDQSVLTQVRQTDTSESPRDRLFDVIMMRFDAMQTNRDGYKALVRFVLCRPAVLLQRIPAVVHSMALMLIAAGINADGLLGAARAHALAAAYGYVVRIWLKDGSLDIARTMSALDKALSRLEKVAKAALGRRTAAKSDTPKDTD